MILIKFQLLALCGMKKDTFLSILIHVRDEKKIQLWANEVMNDLVVNQK